MQYRRLGKSGLQLSALSLGSWVTYSNQVGHQESLNLLAAARDAGVNFFDNAQAYAKGESERIMGQSFKDLAWDRDDFIVSTKFYWGLKEGVNQKNTLNRKYLMHAIDGSLQRLGLDYVDLVYCHRPDPYTPIEETVWAMHDMISQGKALYWGTSEWSADEIRAAYMIAEREHLHRPVVEQPQYNMFARRKVEQEFKRLYEDLGMGLTTWSPLASGMLTGKYINGIPEGSRAALPTMAWLKEYLTDPKRTECVKQLMTIAQELDCQPGQLALAWCLKNKNVSTVMTGATSIAQLQENMQAISVLDKLDETVMQKIEAIIQHADDINRSPF